MIRQLRRAALTILKSSGSSDLVRDSSWRRQKLLILCYHGVSVEDEDQWRPYLYMTAQQFQRRLGILKEGQYAVLPLAEALQRLYLKDLPPRSVALTFDDGGYDFYKKAWPVLQQYAFPATVYLTTYYGETQRPIFNLICSYILWKARKAKDVILKEFGIDSPVDLGSEEMRGKIVRQLTDWTGQRNLNGDEEDQVAALLAKTLGVDYEELCRKRLLQIMNSKEVKQLASQGVDFQLHTHRHRTPLIEEQFRREIRDNRDWIVNTIGGTRSHFCYPSGAYRPEFLDWLAKEKVLSATTCDTGLATPASNPLLLPRLIDTSGRTDLEFESWLSGVGHLLSRRSPGAFAYTAD